ncbi:MAG: hypothetical protein IPN11_16485 [Opitutaceae bacterium]|nr:hypothetical protein [Opitutaceae bacterium]
MLLKAVADRLRPSVRRSDFIARPVAMNLP